MSQFLITALWSTSGTTCENSGKYREKFINKVMAIYSAKSRTASAFIVGPAKFKVTERANNSERKHIENFTYWRERYFKLVNRVRKLSVVENLESDKAHLEKLLALKVQYKSEGLKSTNYKIVNLGVKIRYYTKKVEQLTARETLSEMFQEIKVPNGKIYYANDRLIVEHTEKPDSNVIATIKSKGFKYSPKTKTWVRQFTGNAIHSGKQLGKLLNKIDLSDAAC